MFDRKATAPERIAAALKDRILRSEFSAGAPLREEELAREFEASRHVIREALRSLVSAGLVEYVPFRGVRVPLLNREDVADIYAARKFVECAVIETAGARIDVSELRKINSDFTVAVRSGDWQAAFIHDGRFHAELVAVSPSRRVVKWHNDLLGLRFAHLIPSGQQLPRLERSIPQHEQVIEALATGDVSLASQLLTGHLDDSEIALLDCVHSGGKPALAPNH